MIPNNILKLVAVAFLSSVLFSVETTSDFKGKVTDNFGNALSDAEITITNTSTNRSSSTSANDSGNFVLSNLPVGGPYTVLVRSSAGSQRYTDVYLNLGQTLSLNVVLTDFEQLVVTGDQILGSQVALGPSKVFDTADLDAAVAYNRDIKEVLAEDPRLYVDVTSSEAYSGLQCNGQNPRYNSFSLDGIAMNDGFGLNSNGYPTNRLPFSYDSIQQVSAEFAPFDVKYGGFSACVINAVTRSGTNEITGSAYYEYTDDGLLGTEIEGNKGQTVPFEESKIGFTVGGPLVKDKAFFFISAERYDDVDVDPYGPLGSGAPSELGFLRASDYNRIIDIAKNKYGFDPGGIGGALDSYDNKFLARFDVEADDNNSLSITFNYNDGFNNQASDSSPSEFEFNKHFYERGHEMMALNLELFSQLTDSLDSELRVGYRDVDNRQIGIGGPFGDFQIDVLNPENNEEGTVYLGGTDDSRQANKMDYSTTVIQYSLNQLVGSHLITYGLEIEDTDIFNLFMQHSLNGEWDFYGGIDDFDNGLARVYFGNAPSLDESKAAADWGYGLTTLFIQDEIQASDNVEVVVGLRYDTYTVTGQPAENATFKAAHGYSNTITHDGADALMFRLGFNWDIDGDSTLYGGYGGFSGGNPNVWYSNMFSNDGVTAIQTNARNLEIFDIAMCNSDTGAPSDAGPGFAVPCELVEKVQSGSADSDTNTTDANFEVPIVHKVALGFNSSFGVDDLLFNADVIFTQVENPAIIRDVNNVPSGETDFTGRPLYSCAGGNKRDSFTCFGPFDFQLTNSDLKPEGLTYSASLSKLWRDHDVRIAIGYANTSMEDVSPMTSSVAYSNYTGVAVTDRNNPALGNSNHTIPERVTASLRYSPVTIEGGYRLKVSLFLNHFQSRSYSYIYDGEVHGQTPAFTDQSLLYVPVNAADPNVVFDGIDPSAFFSLTDAAGCPRGQYCPRNSIDGSWNTMVNMKVAQEFPGFVAGHEAELYMVIRNLGNLLDSNYGVFREPGFPLMQRVARMSEIDDDGRYVYDRLYSPRGSSISPRGSVYEVKFGFYYRF